MNESLLRDKLQLAQENHLNGNFRQAAQIYQEVAKLCPEMMNKGLSTHLAQCLCLATDWKEISQNLPSQANFFEISGWLNSLFQGKAVNYSNQPIPWYTYPAIEFIEPRIKSDFHVFEFGAGQSTLWWSSRVKKVISIESDSQWLEAIQQKMPSNVILKGFETEVEYSQSILTYKDHYFDVIIIDGINRNQCLKNSLKKLKKDGFIIFDNTDDSQYNSSVSLLKDKGFQRLDFWGLIPGYFYKNCTSIFFQDFSILGSDVLPSQQISSIGPSCLQAMELNRQNLKTQASNHQVDESWQLNTPVVFLIFNRPETTQQVFDVIRQAQPQKLLVVADGPRNDRPEDVDNCRATRAILEQVDWDCEVLTNYSDLNLGCRKRISSGLTWAFEQVEEAIILEDDCLPDPSFFQYCQELLDYYRQDDRIMTISGDNFQLGNNQTEYSYYFSRYSHIWGWATWRRAWQYYDENLLSWPKLRSENWLKNYLKDDRAALFWTRIFDLAYQGYDSWDYGWLFASWIRNGLSVVPSKNLVSNIGFGAGTHTAHQKDNPLANLPVSTIQFPLNHPPHISIHKIADQFTEYSQFSGQYDQEDWKLVQSLVDTFICKTFDLQETCKICGSKSYSFFNTEILGKYYVKYFQCSHCGFVQTEKPYWLEEAYNQAITASDVSYVTRNNALADLSTRLLGQFFDNPQATFLDYGGGYGLFVRLMRDRGFNFYWYDKFCQNIFAQGFERDLNQAGSITLVTAFEVFEHLEHPLETLEQLLKTSSTILINTELLPNTNPTANEWWYYTPYEGQHISIFTERSLQYLANKYQLHLYTDGKAVHLLTHRNDLPQDLFNYLNNPELKIAPRQSLLGDDFRAIVQKISTSLQSHTSINQPVNLELTPPIIVIDTVFFQLYQTGIARVWRSLLEYWSHTEFSQHLLILDRLRTAPRFSGLHYLDIPGLSYDNIENDRQMLQKICDANQASLFISSYYTIPTETLSVMMVYDMIPEVMEANLDQPMWRSKHEAIDHASHFISISENTALDLIRYRPDLDSQTITIAHCGVSPHFKPASNDIIEQFKFKYGIQKPYFMIIGCPKTSYKNTRLFYQGLSQITSRFGFEIISIGAYLKVDSDFRELASGITIHTLNLSDEELTIAYSGAIALVYPSQYEGFGLPIVEAMACGCPVITCPNSSIPEVAGDAAIYILDEDVDGMAEALCEVQKPAIRETIISIGLEQSKKFSWETMATIVQEKLLVLTLLPARLSHWNLLYSINFDRPDDELQAVLVELLKTSLEFYHQHLSFSHSKHQPDPNEETMLDNNWGLTVFVQADPLGNEPEDFDLLLSSASFEFLASTNLEMTDRLQIYLLPRLSDPQKAILESHLSRPKSSL